MSEIPILASIKKIKVFISVPQGGNDAWWLPKPYDIVDKIENSNLVLFTGGSDVSPSLYGHPSHATTCSKMSRDEKDLEVYKIAKDCNIPMVGICRGAQFLCVKAGGVLIQDQDNHLSIERINTFTKKHILVRSDHHQAQYPWQLPILSWDLLGWTERFHKNHIGWNPSFGFCDLTNNGFFKDRNPLKNNILPEIEDVYYRNINALAIQSHPEWLNDEDEGDKITLNHYRSLVLRLMVGWDKVEA